MSIRSIKFRLHALMRALAGAATGLIGGGWRQAFLRLAILASVLGAGGFLVAWSGLVSVSASEGHWPITRWVLQFAMRNAVETHAPGTDVPPLEDKALVLRGAGHYATGCAPCHGAPGQPRSLIVRQMTPRPPFLPPKIHEWTSAQLFWIVKHGIKYTAMPAWVSQQREDEVWAMVAFLEQLSELSPATYRELAYGLSAAQGGDPGAEPAPGDLRPLSAPPSSALANCNRCHGRDGAGRGLGAFPKLAGQSRHYLEASLRAFASGERHSGIMQPVAAALNENTIVALARHYSRLSSTSEDSSPSDSAPSPAEDSDRILRGRGIAENGIYQQGVPACADCHGPTRGPRNSYYPQLAGQYPDYLILQLSLFKTNQRGGTPYAHIMTMIAKRLNKQQMQEVASYYASLNH